MKTPTIDEMRDMFRAHTEAAVKVIVDIMTNGTGAKGEATRLAAAKEILNRGWGRPTTYKDKDAPPPEDPWRSLDGKTYQQVYAEKEAEVAAQKAAAAAAAPEPQALPPAAERSASPAAPAPVLAPPSPARHPDPTGYLARRALFSGPAPAAASRTPAGAPGQTGRAP